MKMITMENKAQNSIGSNMPSNQAGPSNRLPDQGLVSQPQVYNPGQQHPNIGQNSNTQNIHGQSFVGSSTIGQSSIVQSMYPSSQGQMPGWQQVVPQQQQQQQQQQSQNPQQILYQQQFQQHQQNLLHPNQFQSSHQSVMQPSMMQTSLSSLPQNQQSNYVQQHSQAVRHHQQQASIAHHQQTTMNQRPILPTQQQLMRPQSNVMNVQQHSHMLGSQNNVVGDIQHSQRLLSQQNNLLNRQQRQQQFMNQQNNLTNIHQQQLGTNVPRSQKQQLFGNQGMQTSHHSAHMLQQPKVSMQQQPQQSASNMNLSQIHTQPTQLQQQLGLQQLNPLQRDMQQKLQASGSLHQQQNVLDQQNQILYQSQRVLPETPNVSADSSTQVRQISEAELERAYQKIQIMKEKFLPDLNELYRKIAAKLQQYDSIPPQQPKSDQVEKLRAYRLMAERMIALLQISKNNIMSGLEEKLESYEKKIINMLSANKPRTSLQPGHLPPTAQSQSQENQMNSQLQPLSLQSSAATIQQNTIANLQHNSMSSLSTAQLNILNSVKHGTNLGSGQGNSMNSLQQLPASSLQQNSVSTPQQTNANSSSSQGGENVIQPNPNTLQSGSTMVQHHLKHQQEQQMLPNQSFKQQYQQRQFSQRQQQQLHQPAKHQMNDTNEMKMRQGTGSVPVSSPQVDQQTHLQSLSKVATPLQSSNPTVVAPTPSTPMAPSPILGDSEKHIPAGGGAAAQAPTPTPTPAQSLAIGTPGISASPLLGELNAPDGLAATSERSTAEQPLERLIRAVKSMSTETLAAALGDIRSVVSLNDMIAGSAPGNGSRSILGEDLVSIPNCHLQARDFITQDGSTNGIKRMKRYIRAKPVNVVPSAGNMNDDIQQPSALNAPEMESTAQSNVKKPKIEVNDALLEEIKQVNRGLIDTVVEICDEDDDLIAFEATVTAAEMAEGTILKCSFIPVAVSPTLKSHYDSLQTPIKPLHLLVPAKYPDCSPILLDKFPVESSVETEDLAGNAKAKFSTALRSLSLPISVKEIAKTWDKCGRGALCEYAQQRGGGTFSSKHGAWENC